MVCIDTARCIGCKKCAEICPVNNIFIKKEKACVRQTCMNCGHCFSICPVEAVQMPDIKDFEPSVSIKDCQVDSDTVLSLIKSRRSIRRYKNLPVPKSTLAQLLEAGRFAPTAGNAQNVRYVVIQNQADTVKQMVWNQIHKILEESKSPNNPLGNYKDTLQKIWESHLQDPPCDKLFLGSASKCACAF